MVISDFYYVSIDQVVWDILLRRNLLDLETNEFSDLFQIISFYWIRLWWGLSCVVSWLVGCFSLKSFYTLSNQVAYFAIVNPDIWTSKALPQAISFLWTTRLGKILTQDNLLKRGRILVSVCPFCLQDSEETYHLPIHCPFSSTVWNVGLHPLSMFFKLIMAPVNWINHIAIKNSAPTT